MPLPPEILKKVVKYKCPSEEREMKINKLMPILQIDTFSRYLIMNRSKIKNRCSGIIEMLSSLDFAFRQVSLLLRLPRYNRVNELSSNIRKMEVTHMVESCILNTMKATNCVYYIISSVRDEIISINKWRQGYYILALDPISGVDDLALYTPSSTFAIYSPNQKVENYKDLLNTCGEEALVAGGYVLYGASTILVVSFLWEKNILEFTYDQLKGQFVLINRMAQIPRKGSLYCLDNATRFQWSNAKIQNFLLETQNSLYHFGSLVANFNYFLKTGGLVVDPPMKNSPEGKFQIISTLNPLAMICNAAGGISYGGKKLDANILKMRPTTIHETTPCIFGSELVMDSWNNFIKEFQ